MDIDQEIIMQLVAGQGRIEQGLKDTVERIDRAIPYMESKHTGLEDRVRKVENKVWYFSGIGTAVGMAIGHFITYFKR